MIVLVSLPPDALEAFCLQEIALSLQLHLIQIEDAHKHKNLWISIKYKLCFNTFIDKVELVNSGDIKW